jgi:hypothetical protein
MKRGVLEITKPEFTALTARFDPRKFMGTTVANKVVAAMNSAQEPVRLELSEEELEVIMDELAVPSSSDSLETVSVRKKMTDLMAKFRSVV